MTVGNFLDAIKNKTTPDVRDKCGRFGLLTESDPSNDPIYLFMLNVFVRDKQRDVASKSLDKAHEFQTQFTKQKHTPDSNPIYGDVLTLAQKNVRIDTLLYQEALAYSLIGKLLCFGTVLGAGGVYSSIRWMKRASGIAVALAVITYLGYSIWHRGDRQEIMKLCGEMEEIRKKLPQDNL